MSHRQTAKDNGWKEIAVKPGDVGRMESYVREGSGGRERLNYYPSTGCVGTSMDHPSQGKTQMFRRDVPVDQIMENPRTHTGHGYQTKK
jgi:hypothetical protein